MLDTEHEIQKKITDLETRYGIKVLYACESGSRAWGFESKDSDWDVRLIYAHPPEKYCAVFFEELEIESRQSINLPLDQNDIDVAGWDVQKTFGLIYNSNPTVWEWLTSPIIYRSTPVVELIRDTARSYYTKNACIHHYHNMARGNFLQYIQAPAVRNEMVSLKKYLYALRPILACLWQIGKSEPPPMEFARLIQGEFHRIPAGVRSAIEKLVVAKKAGVELGKSKPIEILDEWLSEKLNEINQYKENMEAFSKRPVSELNERFREALRITSGVEVPAVPTRNSDLQS